MFLDSAPSIDGAAAGIVAEEEKVDGDGDEEAKEEEEEEAEEDLPRPPPLPEHNEPVEHPEKVLKQDF